MSETKAVSRKRTGKCLCGAVRFHAIHAEADVGACHCGMCQRWTGSALLTVTVPSDGLEIEDREHLATYASSAWAERAFCSKCGSNLYYRVLAPGPHHGMHYLAAGTLDDVSGLRLGHEIFFDKRSSVFDFAGDTRKQTEAEVMAQFAGPTE